MIARWPGRVPAGRVSREPWVFYDFMPTAAELCGARCPKGLDGLSVAPALMGRPQPPRDYFYWETNARDGFTQAVRSGNWKAVRFEETNRIELYDLAADPGETRNLAAANAGVVDRLRSYMQAAHVDNPEYPIQTPPKNKNKKKKQ
jgi:arylsulfatase A-like enzyme